MWFLFCLFNGHANPDFYTYGHPLSLPDAHPISAIRAFTACNNGAVPNAHHNCNPGKRDAAPAMPSMTVNGSLWWARWPTQATLGSPCMPVSEIGRAHV